jgi:alkylation response protein AidB-like acyl-CoA dehydrogenase
MTAALATIEDDVTEFRPPPLRARPARRIRDDAEALAVAEDISAKLAEGAAARDRDCTLPYEEVDFLSDAGLLAITVPKAYGGAGVNAGTVAHVIAALSRADGSIGQIPQNHFFMLEGLRLQGTEEQKRFFYGRVLAGERLGNALSETGTKTAHGHATRLSRDGSIYRLSGRKFYSTGVLFAHWVAVVANDENNASAIAFVPRDTKGILDRRRLDRLRSADHRLRHNAARQCGGASVRHFVVRRFVRASDLHGPVRPDHARRSRTGHRRGGAR